MSAIQLLVQLANLQTAFMTLDEALKVTNRRVNALENVVKPKIENTISYIKAGGALALHAAACACVRGPLACGSVCDSCMHAAASCAAAAATLRVRPRPRRRASWTSWSARSSSG